MRVAMVARVARRVAVVLLGECDEVADDFNSDNVASAVLEAVCMIGDIEGD